MANNAYKSLLIVCMLLFPATWAIAAAPFLLPDDAVIDIQPFTFPESARSDSEQNLPEAFRVRIVHAMEQAKFSVWSPRNTAPGNVSAAVPAKNSSDDLKTTHLREKTDPEGDGAASQEFDAPFDADTDTFPSGILAPPVETPENAPPDTDEKIPVMPPGEPQEPLLSGARQSAAAGPTHILVGNVTLFRETVGAPTRIAGTIRVRAETSLHCVYKIKDVATGKVIISNAASGSSASVTAQTQEIDAILASHTSKALTMTAINLVADLSGTSAGKAMEQDRGYYQDSPGKRLKPKQRN